MSFDRRSGIGGTDARHVMAGDWLHLWEEKTGRRHPPPLGDIFRVQLGLVTQRFHLEWIAKRQKIDVLIYPNDDAGRIIDPSTPWRYITLDGMDETNGVAIEVKHSHSANTIRECAEYYMAQLQHNMSITGHLWMWLSMIPGNAEPLTVRIDRDAEYIERLMEMEQTFWWHVTKDVKPDIIPSAKLEAAADRIAEITVGGFKDDLDMDRHNEWIHLAHRYGELKPKATEFNDVCAALKALIPPDRRRCYGHGVQVVRDKAGRLSIREFDDLL